MFDIGDKKKLISEIQGSVWNHYISKPYCQVDLNNPSQAIHDMALQIAREVTNKAVEQILERLYTYSEFEQDLGIKKDV